MKSETEAIERADLVQQLQRLGLRPGAVLVVHSSFRAIGPLVGGPSALIDALVDTIGSEGTLVMPSFSDWDDDKVFDPLRTPCRQLGVVADTFWRGPGTYRSDSPHSFAAKGPHARAITLPHPPELPHGPDSPIGRVHDLDGWILLLGVGHDCNTTVHLAEFFANVPYRSPKFCTVVWNGVRTRVDYGEMDHCCKNFSLVGEWLDKRGLQSRGQVGHGEALFSRAEDVVATVVAELKNDPLRFLCPPNARCVECDEARSSVASTTDIDG